MVLRFREKWRVGSAVILALALAWAAWGLASQPGRSTKTTTAPAPASRPTSAPASRPSHLPASYPASAPEPDFEQTDLIGFQNAPAVGSAATRPAGATSRPTTNPDVEQSDLTTFDNCATVKIKPKDCE